MHSREIERAQALTERILSAKDLPSPITHSCAEILRLLILIAGMIRPSTQHIEWTARVWQATWESLISEAVRLVSHAEIHTGSRPGCLPQDIDSCELMTLAHEISWCVSAGSGFALSGKNERISPSDGESW